METSLLNHISISSKLMHFSRFFTMKRIMAFFLVVFSAYFLSGCASYKPKFDSQAVYFDRVQAQTDGSVKVSVVGLSAKESKETFATNLAAKEILPVWIKIENNDPDRSFYFMERSIDPDYYTPGEAAFKTQLQIGYRFSKLFPPFLIKPIRALFFPLDALVTGAANEKMRLSFEEQALKYGWIKPGETRSGFVFIPASLGSKEIAVDLYGDDLSKGQGTIKRFNFFIVVPGLKPDYRIKEFEKYYKPKEFTDYENEKSLLAELEKLPPAVTNMTGTKNGDPVNLIVIGELNDLLTAFIASKWDETEEIYWNSIWKMITSFSFKKNYQYSPVSPLYLYGRSQDIAFQKARKTINERMHLRLWYSPMRYQGKPVWVGQVSRDIGVRFTTKAWNLMTHKIDPDIDEAAVYVLSDLLYWNRVEKYGLAGGLPVSTADEPLRNLTGDPYYTAGKRLVLLLPKLKHKEFPEEMFSSPN